MKSSSKNDTLITMKKLRNSYFMLRHGRNIHQTEKENIVYDWISEDPPCVLDSVGIEQIKASAEKLASENINLIFSSDILRTRQSAEIVAERLRIKEINYDERLRDDNWGIFQGKTKQEAWAYFKNMEEKFDKAVPEGESWNDCYKRMTDFLKEIDNKYENKTILIVSHGDPLWLLECLLEELSKKEMLEKRLSMMKVGEVRKL